MDKHPDKDTQSQIIAMKALVLSLRGQVISGRQLISKAIHIAPDQADLWRCMAKHLLNHHSAAFSTSAANCAQKAAGLCQNDSSDLLSIVGLCLLNGSDKNKAKMAAIKAIHCYPENPEPWSVLTAASKALENNDKNNSVERIVEITKAVVENDGFNKINNPLREWIKNL